MRKTRTYGLDVDTIAFAARVKAGSGKTILTENLKQINKFVVGTKRLGIWNNMVCWPMRSIHNAGRGSVIYSLGGLGVFNGTISNIALWSDSGIRTISNVAGRPSFPSFTYAPNNFNGTICCVGGLLYASNQRLVGHSGNFGGWLIATVSANTSYSSYFDTVSSSRVYGANVSNNNRDTVSFVGMSRNLSGNTTYYVSNPNTGQLNFATSTAILLNLTTVTSSTYMQAGLNSFLIHINDLNYTQDQYKTLETLLRKSFFKDNIFQWTY